MLGDAAPVRSVDEARVRFVDEDSRPVSAAHTDDVVQSRRVRHLHACEDATHMPVDSTHTVDPRNGAN